MSDMRKIIRKQILPMLALRGLTVFPYMILHFDVGRPKSLKALEVAMENNQLVFLIAQKEAKIDNPTIDDLCDVGVIAKVKQLIKLPGGTVRALVEGLSRAKISKVISDDLFSEVETEEKMYMDYEEDNIQNQALIRTLKASFEEYIQLSNKFLPEIALTIETANNVSQIADIIAANLSIEFEEKQMLLSEYNLKSRVIMLLEIMNKEKEILHVEKDIANKVKKQIDKNQKEYYLREQLKVIENELGDKDGIKGEVEDYKRRVLEAKMPEEVEQKCIKEVDRLLKIPSGSAEGSVVRNYIDWMLDLPWYNTTEELKDLNVAEKILEEDHYGLEKVKERIIEYLAVRMLSNNLNGPILCLIGPPGVGKTSIAKSIARALNRKYIRMSLGGVKDESEIRGHRKTYVGSMPGRIINAMKQAGTMNPLILLDEIDKMSNDYKGDPASAMLEVLDGEQNNTFRDHYLEVPYDLSQVLFLTTANDINTIPRPLLDRMEIINLSGYTEEEKLNIAVKYLLPKQLQSHGLAISSVNISEQIMRDIINYYTREAGVRNLERQIGKICRKVAREIAISNKKSIKITNKRLEEYLGTKIYKYDKIKTKNEVGIVTGLSWTPVGGDTLSIEVNVMEGTGKLELTGQLGDVMKESARAAISYIRSNVLELNIDVDFYKNKDIHIHVPEGAIPKDGPSAGITMATAMISALTGIAVKKEVAMTGEITIRGRVLPIGGLKEKILAANRAGITTVVLPEENKKDLDEIPQNVKSKMRFVLVENMNSVLEIALEEYKANFNSKTLKSKADKKTILPILKSETDTQKPLIIQ